MSAEKYISFILDSKSIWVTDNNKSHLMGCCQAGAGKANGKQGHGVIDSALGPSYRVKLKHEYLIKSQHLQIRGEGEIDGGGGKKGQISS